MRPTREVTKLTLKGREYTLLFDLEAVALAEEHTDLPLLTGLKSKDINSPKLLLVRGMLFACIRANHPELSFEDVKALITPKALPKIWAAVLKAWFAGMADEDEDEVDIPLAQGQS